MKPVKMLPCPFCGGPPCVIVQNDHPQYGLAKRLETYGEIGKEVRAFVFCHECGAQGETEEDCIYTGDEYDDLETRACVRWNQRDSRHRSLYDAGDAECLNLHPRPNTNSPKLNG